VACDVFTNPDNPTFSPSVAYRRQANFISADTYDLFVQCLQDMRHRFAMCIYGYVVMPEHVHLLVNEPERLRWPMPGTF